LIGRPSASNALKHYMATGRDRMSEDRDWGWVWGLLLLLGLALLAVISLLFSRRREEESYEMLLSERDRALEELRRLSALRAEGKLSEEEYASRRKVLLKEVERIERKLEECEKRN